LTTKDY